METWDAIRSRRNVRSYEPTPLPPADLERILEAGRRAPSATVWQGARHIPGSVATIALLLAEPEADRYRMLDQFDLGQASYAMCIAAADLGIGSGHSAVGDQDAARRILGFPDSHYCAYLIGLGYPMLGQMGDELAARSRPACLHEAQMSRRHLGLEGELELAEPPMLTPLAQQVADSGSGRDHSHGATVPPTPPRFTYLAGNRFGAPSPGRSLQSPTPRSRTMSDVTNTVDTYLAMWNETDSATRADHISSAWSAAGHYIDPLMEGKGHDGLSAMVDGVQAQFPGGRFSRTTAVDEHHGLVRFGWQLAGADGTIIAAGLDVGVLAEDGRFDRIAGFLGDLQPAS